MSIVPAGSHREPMVSVHASEGSLEAGVPSSPPKARSDAGWQMSVRPLSRHYKLNVAPFRILSGSTRSPLWMMWPRLGGSGGGGGDFAYRIPPARAPEDEQRGSSRAWAHDLQVRLLLTDLQPAQQAAAVVTRLGGAACVGAEHRPSRNTDRWSLGRSAVGSDHLH